MERIYNEYGKFMIYFENICFRMNYCIRQICTRGNLFSADDKNIEILLQGLTAYPILTKFKSIVHGTDYSTDTDILKLTDIFYSNFLKVIEYRNLIAHGTFFSGDPHGNIDKFQIRNPKLNKKGFYDNTNVVDVQSLKNLNIELERLEKFLAYLSIFMQNKSEALNTKTLVLMKTTLNGLSINFSIDYKSYQM